MGKSEAALQAQVDALTKIVTAFVNKPMQKAITGTTYVAKNEGTRVRQTMNTAEVTAKLSELTRSPELKKWDPGSNHRVLRGSDDLDAIEHHGQTRSQDSGQSRQGLRICQRGRADQTALSRIPAPNH